MVESIETLLDQVGPCLSTTLVQRLTKIGLSEAAARKRVSRATKGIRRLDEIRFARNATFLYLEKHEGTDRLWRSLREAFKTSGVAYWGSIVALEARGGLAPRAVFDSSCGAPLNRHRQVSTGQILNGLKRTGILDEIHLPDLGECVAFQPSWFEVLEPGEIRGRLLAESIALAGIKDWLRKIGLVSYNSVRIRGDQTPPQAAGFRWDLTGPSYVRHVTKVTKNGVRPGFFACDILLGSTVDVEVVKTFKRKCIMATSPPNMPTIFPLFVADGYSRQGFDYAKRKGMVATTVNHILGEEVARALHDLIGTISRAAAVAARHPENLSRLLSSLSRIEGAAGNLRGALFELIVGHLVKQGNGSIEIREIVQDDRSGRRAEIDVLLVKNRRDVRIYECRGHQPVTGIDPEDLEKWVTQRVPMIYQIMRRRRFPNANLSFEFWTSGRLDDACLEYLQGCSRATSRYKLRWKDGEQIRQYAQKIGASAIVGILNEHYLKHPVADDRSGRGKAQP